MRVQTRSASMLLCRIVSFCFLRAGLLGKDFRKLRVAGFFIFGINGFGQKLLELLIELRQPPFDIGKAHRLTLHRQKLQRKPHS